MLIFLPHKMIFQWYLEANHKQGADKSQSWRGWKKFQLPGTYEGLEWEKAQKWHKGENCAI